MEQDIIEKARSILSNYVDIKQPIKIYEIEGDDELFEAYNIFEAILFYSFKFSLIFQQRILQLEYINIEILYNTFHEDIYNTTDDCFE